MSGAGEAERAQRVNIIERYLDAIQAHDWEAFAATLADVDFSRTGPYGDTYATKQEYVAFISQLMPTLPGYEMRVERVTPAADGRSVTVELSETVEVDGTPLLTPEALVFDLDGDGRIRRIQIFIQRLART